MPDAAAGLCLEMMQGLEAHEPHTTLQPGQHASSRLVHLLGRCKHRRTP